MGHQNRRRRQADRLAVNQKTEPLREKLRFNTIRPLGRNDINSAFRRKRISLSGEMELRFRRNVTPFRPMQASKKAPFYSSEGPKRSHQRFFAASCEKGTGPKLSQVRTRWGSAKWFYILFLFFAHPIFSCAKEMLIVHRTVLFFKAIIYIYLII